MLDQVAGMLGLWLAAVFYAITAYHLTLVFLGLRYSRSMSLGTFDKGALRNPVDLPTVSILIPAKDEKVVIEGAIHCADSLDYPREKLEIIVVEDGSTDETPGIAHRMEPHVRNLIALTGGETKGKPAALNRALRAASGDVIAVFDSDSRYDNDILLRMAKHFHDRPDVAIVQAFPEVVNSHASVITKLNALEMYAWYRGMQAARSRLGLFVHLGGTGMFIRRPVFQALGCWDEASLTEDLDFSLQVARAGFRVGMLPAPVRIQPTYRAMDFLNQRRRWWGGALQVVGKALRRSGRVVSLLRRRIDAAGYLAAPVAFFLGSLSFLLSIALISLRADFGAAVAAWIFGMLGSNLVLAPLVVAQTVRLRNPANLLLLPGLYAYWLLQFASFSWAIMSLAVGARIPWVRTPKRRSEA